MAQAGFAQSGVDAPRASPAAPASAAAVPAGVAATLSPAVSLRPLGQAQLRVWGFNVYQASLWATTDFRADDFARATFALELLYERDLSGAAIAQRSLQEMQRLGTIPPAQAQAWLGFMTRAFPDVKKGDRLTGVHQSGNVTFLHNGRPTAQLRDADFARLFFGIWLSAQTSEPALREALLAGARP